MTDDALIVAALLLALGLLIAWKLGIGLPRGRR